VPRSAWANCTRHKLGECRSIGVGPGAGRHHPTLESRIPETGLPSRDYLSFSFSAVEWLERDRINIIAALKVISGDISRKEDAVER